MSIGGLGVKWDNCTVPDLASQAQLGYVLLDGRPRFRPEATMCCLTPQTSAPALSVRTVASFGIDCALISLLALYHLGQGG
jgi:hypothetical protein